MSNSPAELAEEITDREIRQAVTQKTNTVYEPVVFTAEVAESLGVPEDVAYKALSSCSYVSEKRVGETSVWW